MNIVISLVIVQWTICIHSISRENKTGNNIWKQKILYHL